MGMDLLDQRLYLVALQRDFSCGTRAAFLLARTPTPSRPYVKTAKRTLIRTATSGRVLVVLVEGLALCYWESNNLT